MKELKELDRWLFVILVSQIISYIAILVFIVFVVIHLTDIWDLLLEGVRQIGSAIRGN